MQDKAAKDESDAEGAQPALWNVIRVVFDVRSDRLTDAGHQSGHNPDANCEREILVMSDGAAEQGGGEIADGADGRAPNLATAQAGGAGIADTTFWALILRSAAAYQAFRRHEPRGADPARVARFLLANASQPRSIAYCADNIQTVLEDLRRIYGLRQARRALERLDSLGNGLLTAADDHDLVGRLHAVNDWLQQQLIALTTELGEAFFGLEPPMPEPAGQTQRQTQTQTQSLS